MRDSAVDLAAAGLAAAATKTTTTTTTDRTAAAEDAATGEPRDPYLQVSLPPPGTTNMSGDCQADDDDDDESRPRPPLLPNALVSRHPVRGRCLVATRDFAPGEPILICAPFALVPDARRYREICARCVTPPPAPNHSPASQSPSSSPSSTGPPQPLIPCAGGCGRAHYCSDACRADDWAAGHWAECGSLKEYFFGTTGAASAAQDATTASAQGDTPAAAAAASRLRPPDAVAEPLLDEVVWLLLRAVTRLVLPSSGRSPTAVAHLPPSGATARPDGVRDTPADRLWDLCANAASVDPRRLRTAYARVALCLARCVAFALAPAGAAAATAPDVLLPAADDPVFDDVARWVLGGALTNVDGNADNDLRAHPLLHDYAARVAPAGPAGPAAARLLASCLALLCKEQCNSFGLYSHVFAQTAAAPRQSFAIGLYPDAVFFNHACAPNVAHLPRAVTVASATASVKEEEVVVPGCMVFFAVGDVQRGDELRISYVGAGEVFADDDDGGDTVSHVAASAAANAVAARRRALQAMFYFDCACARCASETAEAAARARRGGCDPRNGDDDHGDDDDGDAAAVAEAARARIAELVCRERRGGGGREAGAPGCRGVLVPEALCGRVAVCGADAAGSPQWETRLGRRRWCEACGRRAGGEDEEEEVLVEEAGAGPGASSLR
ncbi:hypothetical protein DFJ73DRAFT_932317 [Zopfochytrium polystomum]|nr:hypothetical protein DFJ73DRAFT_932317 [Zopfochytrium polystomum]